MKNEINNILQINDSYQAPNRLMEVLKSSQEKRDAIFMKFLELWDYDLDTDKFRQYFEQEHAERKSKKQDFTPFSVASILAQITHVKKGKRMDVCSGTGSLIICKWTEDRLTDGFMNYQPNDYTYHCHELSDRSVPFLLFNLSIRGMNGVVYHGDVLEQKYKAIYLIINENNDALGFSGLMEIKPKNNEI